MSTGIAANRWKLGAVIGGVAIVVVLGILVTRSSTGNGRGPVASNLVRGGDLGPIDGEQALRAKLQPALAAKRARPADTVQAAPSHCAGVARKLQPQGAALAYVASAGWQGTPAEVFGFNPPGARATSSPGHPAPTRVYVLARSDCHLLVFQSFSP